MEERLDAYPSAARIQGVPDPAPQAQTPSPPPEPLAHRRQTWPAVLAVYLLAPFLAEMVTGSTAPLKWNNIGGVILTLGLYGSGAVLARELVRRRGLGWGRLACLGAAYGVLEEGLSFQSWFNPTWTPPPDRLRFFEVNWTFALAFTTIHVALSILSSIVIAEACFPKLADRPWLGRKGFAGFTAWLSLIVAWIFFNYGFVIFHGKGYDHPPVSYLIAPLLFGLFLWLGLRRSRPQRGAPETRARPAPGLWTLRGLAFAAAFLLFANMAVVRVLSPIPLIPVIVIAGVDLLAVLLVRSFARRPNWGAAHRLALAIGVIGFFIALAPVAEFVLHVKLSTGLTLVDLLALGGLIWLARRTARVDAATRSEQSPLVGQKG